MVEEGVFESVALMCAFPFILAVAVYIFGKIFREDGWFSKN